MTNKTIKYESDNGKSFYIMNGEGLLVEIDLYSLICVLINIDYKACRTTYIQRSEEPTVWFKNRRNNGVFYSLINNKEGFKEWQLKGDKVKFSSISQETNAKILSNLATLPTNSGSTLRNMWDTEENIEIRKDTIDEYL